jgi:hypothetical protein
MVVTDLHGDWDLYRRYRDRFLTLRERGEARRLIVTGDLIHSEEPEDDRSLALVLDLLALQERLGDDLVCLLGNHELPHLYGVTLQKGDRLYTPSFEAALGEHRSAVLAFFDRMPFYVRTRAGVSLCHAGACAEMRDPQMMPRLFNYSHRRVWEEAAAMLPVERRPSLRRALGKLSGETYDRMVRRYLAVSGPDDPRYDDLLIGSIASLTQSAFELLWAALFSRNELAYGEQLYGRYVRRLLNALSGDFHRQVVLVTGHIACPGGYALVAGRQLRLASGHHARPASSAQYLLFDAGQPVQGAVDLVSCLHPQPS